MGGWPVNPFFAQGKLECSMYLLVGRCGGLALVTTEILNFWYLIFSKGWTKIQVKTNLFMRNFELNTVFMERRTLLFKQYCNFFSVEELRQNLVYHAYDFDAKI